MIPVMCSTKDDCVRACIASILELPSNEVPHFFERFNGENSEELNRNMQEWFAQRRLIAAALGLPGEWSLDVMQSYMRDNYPKQHYMLWCDSGEDHAVVGFDGGIVWNPAWYKCGIDGPHSSGYWIVWIIAKL